MIRIQVQQRIDSEAVSEDGQGLEDEHLKELQLLGRRGRWEDGGIGTSDYAMRSF